MNLNLLLMTSTKGHFDRTDIYQKTVSDLQEQIGRYYFCRQLAHIKASPDESPTPMVDFFSSKGLETMISHGQWKHGDQSHQNEYIKDIRTAAREISRLSGEYTLFCEDDWLLRPQEKDGLLWDYFHKSMLLLNQNPDIVQVRVPRFTNEFDRINGLYAKHRIEAKAVPVAGDGIFYFLANDWSNNPFICRTRDLVLATTLMEKNPHAFPNHAEHGFGRAMRYLSTSELCLAVIKPSLVRCFHMGTKVGEEDKMNEPLVSD